MMKIMMRSFIMRSSERVTSSEGRMYGPVIHHIEKVQNAIIVIVIVIVISVVAAIVTAIYSNKWNITTLDRLSALIPTTIRKSGTE